ncbi:MAG: stage V sporulation protein D, partial [Clostridia bacterium]|nr:stage V sporulation protein D [Clostridia bacterium]
MAKTPNRSMIIRIIVVWAIMTLTMFGLIGGRLVYLMVAKSDFYQQKAADQQLYDTVIAAERGEILDRNGELLATSAQVWTVYITPNSFKKITDTAKLKAVKSEIATNLSTILGLDYQTVLDYTNKKTSYVKVKSNVEKPEADKIRQYMADSKYKVGEYMGLDESSKRYYPNDNLASVVLGFVGTDNQGLGGLEKQYDNELTGIPGRVVSAKDATGKNMTTNYEVKVEAKPGNTLITSLDSYVQSVCEKYLDQAIVDNKVIERGAVVCMNVNTGEIMALAVKGDFDPNAPFTLSEADQQIVDALEGDERTKKLNELRNRQWRNKVVSDTYEPGSVFKVVTAAMALEEGVTSLSNH